MIYKHFGFGQTRNEGNGKENTSIMLLAMGKLVNTVAAQPKAVKNLIASTTIPKGVEYVKWTIIKAERAIASEALVAENSGLTQLGPYDLTCG